MFPFGEGGEFRCKRNFVDEEAACEWAASMLDRSEVCYLAECESADYVFEPACESHTVVRWLDSEDAPTVGHYEMYDVIDDFDEAMEIYPIG